MSVKRGGSGTTPYRAILAQIDQELESLEAQDDDGEENTDIDEGPEDLEGQDDDPMSPEDV